MSTFAPNPSQETLFNPVRCFATQGTALSSGPGVVTDDLFKAAANWTIQPPESGTWTPSGPIFTLGNDGVLQVKPPWKGLFYIRITLTCSQTIQLVAMEGSGGTWTTLGSQSLDGGTRSATFLWFRKDASTTLRLRYTTANLLLQTKLEGGSLDVMGVRGWL